MISRWEQRSPPPFGLNLPGSLRTDEANDKRRASRGVRALQQLGDVAQQLAVDRLKARKAGKRIAMMTVSCEIASRSCAHGGEVSLLQPALLYRITAAPG
jgi:hypothetical protein